MAAGCSSPDDGYTGSGIYSGHHGALNATANSVPTTKLLIAEVPKVPQKSSSVTAAAVQRAPRNGNLFPFHSSEIFSEHNLSRLQIRMLNFSENVKQKDVVCQNDFCCNYEVEVSIHKLPENAVSISNVQTKYNFALHSNWFLFHFSLFTHTASRS